MKMDDVDFIIDVLYEAALLPGKWSLALDVLSRNFADKGALLIPVRTSEPIATLASPSMQETAEDYVLQGWWAEDPSFGRWRRRPTAGFVTDLDLFDVDEIRRLPFYQEFMPAQRMGWGSSAMLLDTPETGICLALRRSSKREPYDAEELGVLNRLLPHARRAMAIGATLLGKASQADGLIAAFDAQHRGVILLDRRFRVLFCNAKAESLMGDGIDVAGGLLTASRKHDRPRLHALLASALEGADAVDTAGPVALARAGDRKPLVVTAMPIRREAVLPGLPVACLVVHVIDPEDRPLTAERLLQPMFGLTRGEARLAVLLAGGRSLSAAADQAGITLSTARTVLKAIFLKTETHRQAELVALLASLGA
jgi:DNA-binding CsgD family transcriptional regulator